MALAGLILFYVNALSPHTGLRAAEMPLVYARENTGADCAKPPLPEFSALPSIPFLPDPFWKADGSRITTRDEWRCRRAETWQQFEKQFLSGE